jgi:N-acetylglucosamine kinase-like BadF-type ATPase
MELPPHPVLSVCAGVTKFTRDGIPVAWERFLQAQFPDARTTVVPDYVIAFHSALPTGNGVVVVAGTGSVSYGENPRTGESARCGGRGWEWGDEGSGAWLTTEMVRRTLRALDRQAETSALTRTICAELGTEEPATLAAEARRRSGEEGGAGRGFLLPLLVHLHRNGDAEAQGLFVGAGGWLASLAGATASRLRFEPNEPVTFGAVGGVWKAGGETLEQAFITALRRRYAGATVLTDAASPTEGAVRLAAKSSGKAKQISTAGL